MTWCLRANRQYWRQPSEIDELVLRGYLTAQDQIEALFREEVVLMVNPPADVIAQFDRDERWYTESYQSTDQVFAVLNTQQPPFSRRMMRQAAMAAIDREALGENVLVNQGESAVGPVSPAFPYVFNTALVPHPFDGVRAARMVADGVGSDREIVVLSPDSTPTVPNMRALSETIVGEWEAAGFSVALESVPWDTFLARASRGSTLPTTWRSCHGRRVIRRRCY